MRADLKHVCSSEYLQLLHVLKADSELSPGDCPYREFSRRVFCSSCLQVSWLIIALLNNQEDNFTSHVFRDANLTWTSVSPVVVMGL